MIATIGAAQSDQIQLGFVIENLRQIIGNITYIAYFDFQLAEVLVLLNLKPFHPKKTLDPKVNFGST